MFICLLSVHNIDNICDLASPDREEGEAGLRGGAPPDMLLVPTW